MKRIAHIYIRKIKIHAVQSYLQISMNMPIGKETQTGSNNAVIMMAITLSFIEFSFQQFGIIVNVSYHFKFAICTKYI